MATPSRSRRDFAALEARRFQAARLFAKGESQGVVARALGVTPVTAHHWYHAWHANGRAGLKAAGRAGRKPKLEPKQLATIEQALRAGPRVYGFSTDLWTLPRVAAVIERLTRVCHHPGACVAHPAWLELVPAAAGTARPGARRGGDRAVEDATVDAAKKNARRQRAWIVFEDESGVSQQPVVRRTWAPRGETPILIHTGGHWKRLSIAGALAFRWDGRRTRFFFHTRAGSYTDAALICFLRDLKRHFPRQRLLLIWDGLSGHTSRVMTAYLARQHPWLTVEP